MAKGFLSGLFGKKKEATDRADKADIPSSEELPPLPDTPDEDESPALRDHEDAPQIEAEAENIPPVDPTDTAHSAQSPQTLAPQTLAPQTLAPQTLAPDVPTHEAPTPESPVADTISARQDSPSTGEHDADKSPQHQSQEHQNTEPPEPPARKKGFFSRLKSGLAKTSNRLSEGVTSIFTKKKLDDDMLEELESLLISADLGVPAATRLTTALAKSKFDKEVSDEDVRQALAADVAATLLPLEKQLTINTDHKPHVILMTGVNGAGKTTTIGKLASKLKAEGKSVMLAAGDTFRAAAIEQLTVWGERTNSPVIARDVGSDAAGLAFDALQQAQADAIDVLMIDTAGRLQNKRELMDELAKIVRVIRKVDPSAPHDTLLVLDATVGQNALSQVAAFQDTADVSGLIMTKLDGTARGGVLVALADKFQLPIHYIGVGEDVDDLHPFNATAFAKALADVA